MSYWHLWLVGRYSGMGRLVVQALVNLRQTLTLFHVLTITKSTSLCLCSVFLGGVFYHQFSLLILTPRHLHPGRCVAVTLGPTTTESCAALKGVGLGAMLTSKCHPPPLCGTEPGDTHKASPGPCALTPQTGSTEQHSCLQGNKKSF